MAKDINKPNVVVDNSTGTPYSAQKNGTVSSILSAKDKTKSASTIQAKNLEDTSAAMSKLNKDLEKLVKTMEGSNIGKSGFVKEFNKAMENFKDSFADTSKIIDKGSTDIVTLAKAVESSNNAYDEMKVYLTLMKKQFDDSTKSLKGLTAEQKKKLENEKADLRYRKNIRANQRQDIVNTAKEGNKDLTKAVQDMARNTQTVLTNIKTAFSLDKLTNSNTRSGAAQIQLDMMNNMNLSKSEFNSFKKQLYGQIDTSIYTAEEVRTAIGTIHDMGINTTTEAVNKMNAIIRGQQLLGLSAEQQSKLQALGNKTGRDSLTFTTNKMAKWMQMSNNLGQKQLSELVDLNTNFLSQFADIGVDSEAFTNMTESASAALTALTGNTEWASRYQDMLTNLATNTDTAASALGMDSGGVKDALSAGKNGADLIYNSAGTYRDLYDQFMSNYDGTVHNLDKITSAYGIDSNTAAFIKEMAKYDRANGAGSFSSYLGSYDADGTDPKALNKMEENTKEATGFLSKLVNNFTNWVSESFDWIDLSNFETSMSIIIGLLGAIAASELLQTGAQLFKGIGKLFKGGKNLIGKGAKAFNGSKWGTGLYSGKIGSGGLGLVSNTGRAGLSTAGTALAGGSIAAGAIWAGVDAYKGFTETSKQMYGENASTGQKVAAGAASLFSGSEVHKNSKGEVDVGKNALKGAGSGAAKGALIGAGLGSFIPGVGTVVGGAVGGLIGGIGGAIGGWFKGKKAKEQEEREKAQLEATEKVAQNTAKANSILGDVRLSTSDRKISSVRAYTATGAGPMGDGPRYSPSALPEVTPTNGMGGNSNKEYPWKVTSPYGSRTLPNGDSAFHNGIDFGIVTGTPIGAPINGTVTSAKEDYRNTYKIGDKSGGTWLYIKGADGVTYQFGHLSKLGVKVGDNVTTGQTIALSGNTGYSTGPHLHFGAKVGGSWKNPDPDYITNGLFSADGKMITNISGVSYSNTTDGESTPASTYKSKIRSLTPSTQTDGMGAVVQGLADIKQTLLELSERQSRDEKIMQMIQGTKKQDPRIA